MVFEFLRTGYQKIKKALQHTGSLLTQKIRNLFSGPIDEQTLDQLEQILYEADFGVAMAQHLTERVRLLHRQNPNLKADDFIELLRQELMTSFPPQPPFLEQLSKNSPAIILIVGVNGNGKTTSIAKLAHHCKQEGKNVLVAAADTFRAAAIEQLETWAGRLNIDIVKGAPNSDPAAVAFDAVQAGRARKADVVLIDTAGRLHTKTNLMQELEKIRRSCDKVVPGAPHETLLVLDATTGQNAIDQAKTFHHHTPITGLILTKLDGTAKGGIVVNIQRQLGIPVKWIGIGEGIEDLEPFNSEAFLAALLPK